MNKPTIHKRKPITPIQRDETRDSILLIAFNVGNMPVAAYTLGMSIKEAYTYATWLDAQDQKYLDKLQKKAHKVMTHNHIYIDVV